MLDVEAIKSDVVDKIMHGHLELPSLPEIAERVREAVNKDTATTAEIAKIIQTDIPITARLIQLANSPVYRGSFPVEHCQDAVGRLGLNVTRNLVTSFALKSVFNSKLPLGRKKMAQTWKDSVKVAAVGFTLARVTPGLDPDRAMLAGLVRNIGILPILTYAESHEEILKHEYEFGQLCKLAKTDLGVAVMEHWGFEDEFVQVIREADHWKRKGEKKPDYVDVVLIAQIHASFGQKDRFAVPEKFKDLPAFGKFPVFKLGEGASVELLKEAHDEMAELQRLLLS
ncbi:MAG: HDOD domain-containing protein [Gammaproteobacteria bacterium]|nr:HDOD domain-containing protein [Gammaproteobacteria bacterium]MDH5728552.1 HDOD domain-containing protein [Gammaproteobacteria bacterium]